MTTPHTTASNTAQLLGAVTPSASLSRSWRPRPLILVAIVIACVGYIPIVMVVVFSFNSSKSLSVFDHPSLNWYQTALSNPVVIRALILSVQVAVMVTVIAVVLGTALALGLRRVGPRLRLSAEGVLLLALVTPEIATAVALLLLFTGAGITLSRTTLILGHVTFSIPYVAILVRARLDSLGVAYEEAAQDLGATRAAALRLAVVPLLLPAIVGAAFLVFLLSFDDFVTSFFNSGPTEQPLPLFIYGSLRFGITPEINAIGTMLMVVTVTLGGLGIYLTSLRGRRTSR